jgi:cell division protease FtsH
MVYGVGQMVGSQIQADNNAPVLGKKTTEEFVVEVEAEKLKGSLVLADLARFYTQQGGQFLISDFSRKASPDIIDRLRKHITVEGNLSISWQAAKVGEFQLLISSFMNTFGQFVIGLLYFFFAIAMLMYVRSMMAQGGPFKKRFNHVDPDMQKLPLFIDVAGHQGPKLEVEEIVTFLKHPERFSQTGARPPRGVLLYGPPGNGKTLIAKAIAGESKAHFVEQNASSFVQLYVGAGAMAVRALFAYARKHKPCVIFIDEIDAVGGTREGTMGGSEERVQTLNALLAELDGFADNEQIVVMAATNRLDHLDEALVRPGRFDRKVMITLPGRDDRLEILNIHSKRIPKLTADLSLWADRTQGFSGADLANLINESAMEASRSNVIEVGEIEFQKARDRILLGPRNFGQLLDPEEREKVAYHEAGHAIIRALVGSGKLDKVTILPHGQALGVTVTRFEKEWTLRTKSQIGRELMVTLGGRAAEETFCSEPSSGAFSDLQTASRMARQSLLHYGFGSDFGPYVPDGDALKEDVERAAAIWIRSLYQLTLSLLDTHRSVVETLTKQLLKDDTVSGEVVHDWIQGLRPEALALFDAQKDITYTDSDSPSHIPLKK